ncbi:MAG TPA: type II toxin-antitoxin system RelE/ParE family toxin [Burkholderiaceae bacterium]|jgi:mRNA-degrading endonuclease RelE of RelBE toxin-antitoxin system
MRSTGSPKLFDNCARLTLTPGKQIRTAVTTELVDLSKARNVKALSNHEHGYRLRVGNYRVFFNFDGAVRIVSIEEVRKRDERTY